MNSSKSTAILSTGESIAIPGHLLNLVVASQYEVVDLDRWFDTIEGNMKMVLGDKKLIAKAKKYYDVNMLVEPDSFVPKLTLWHHPLDFKYSTEMVRFYHGLLDLEEVDFSYIEKRSKRLMKYSKDLPTRGIDELTLNKK